MDPGMKEADRRIALELGVVGLLNIQFAVKDDKVYVLEVNPRPRAPSPSCPRPPPALVRIASACWWAAAWRSWGSARTAYPQRGGQGVRAAFDRFPGVDPLLAPEMRSTGEVNGPGASFGEAFYKGQAAAGTPLPRRGPCSSACTATTAGHPAGARCLPLWACASRHKRAREYLWATVLGRACCEGARGPSHALAYIRHGKGAAGEQRRWGRESQMDDYLHPRRGHRLRHPYTTTLPPPGPRWRASRRGWQGNIFVPTCEEKPAAQHMNPGIGELVRRLAEFHFTAPADRAAEREQGLLGRHRRLPLPACRDWRRKPGRLAAAWPQGERRRPAAALVRTPATRPQPEIAVRRLAACWPRSARARQRGHAPRPLRRAAPFAK